MKEVMTIEQATSEVTAWMDRKKIQQSRRENAKTAIANMIEAVQFGTITINEDGTIEHTLQFAIEDSKNTPVVDKLKYKARVSTDALMKAYNNLKINIPDTQLLALIAELTDQPYGYITKLEPTDLVVAKSIGVFFMS
jgi:hypothetical protein